MSERLPGSKVTIAVENGDVRAALERLAEIARADLAILGEDYPPWLTRDEEADTVSLVCKPRTEPGP
jgi:hypothetical protein